MNPKVAQFLSKAKKWQDEMTLLREIITECKLEEDFKWMHPCYTLDNANVVLIHGFKDYCALLFFKGVLMKDEKKILIQQTENVQDRRQLRFKNVAEIEKLESVIKAYIQEAIAIEKAGLKVVMKTTAEFNMPEEFQTVLEDMPELKKAFQTLTPGRQKAYLLYFSSAKQAKTREARIEKYLEKILNGKGLDDD
ncbi:YdeI/OmpD-associated family protein [Flavobacterium sp. ARAG 55.4]|uniref:YdeI/OmpD-associated family protein n=1 Tax=Flavobacterium sp. ARAG 55.4 TaxID=3451357 RepID=UPI003F4800D2